MSQRLTCMKIWWWSFINNLIWWKLTFRKQYLETIMVNINFISNVIQIYRGKSTDRSWQSLWSMWQFDLSVSLFLNLSFFFIFMLFVFYLTCYWRPRDIPTDGTLLYWHFETTWLFFPLFFLLSCSLTSFIFFVFRWSPFSSFLLPFQFLGCIFFYFLYTL